MTDRQLEKRIRELEERVRRIEAFLQSELVVRFPEIADHFDGAFQSRLIQEPMEDQNKQDED